MPHPAPALAALGAALLLASTSGSQLQFGGVPPSTWNDPAFEAPVHLMEQVDEARLLAEDAVRPKNSAFRFGETLAVDLGFEDGVWETLPDGDRLWRLEIHSPGARSLGLGFSAWELPPGAQLFIVSGTTDHVLGAFTERNNKPWGEMAITQTLGDRIVLEYLVPVSQASEGRLRISDVIHDYRGFWDLLQEKSGGGGVTGNCEINVNCPQGAAWQDQIDATTRLQSGGALCTGSLLNNTAQNGTQLYITASHCGSLNNAVFLFNYQTSGCSGGSSPGNQSVQGSTNLASSSSIDYRLVRITQNIPSSYGAVLAGWNRSGTYPTNTVTVHHPSGGVKKISFDNNSPQKSGQDWRIVQWDLGVTEPGSSGCPLYDQAGRFIGQLWGGAAYCGYPYDDYYGRLELAWSGVSSHLDPIGSGAQFIDAYGSAPPPPADCDTVTLPAGGANIATLVTADDPKIGTTITLSYSGFNGSSTGTLMVSGAQLNQSLFGATIFVDYTNPYVDTSTAIVNGGGLYSLSIPNLAWLVGLDVTVQMGTSDATQPFGWAFSDGLELHLCN